VDAFVERFARLRDRYVQTKLSERAGLIELRRQLGELIRQARSLIDAGRSLREMPAPYKYPWLLRLYQCDRHGTQITPNLEWRNGAWREDDRFLNHNWSWRPYFYQLLAEGWEERRLSLSGQYRDASTNQYCMTAGQFVDAGNRLLLLDIDTTQL